MATVKHRILEHLARLGYASRGVVYVIVGFFAALAAFGRGGDTMGSKDALDNLITQPFGKILLIGVVIGLFGYAIWRFMQSALDADQHGNSAKGLVIRGGLLSSAITHTLLAVYALNLLLGTSSDGGSSSQDWTAWLMSQPYGAWLVGGVGLTIIGAGIAQIVKGFKAGFEKYFSSGAERFKRICQFGLIARGFVFAISGVLFIVAAKQNDPSEAQGLAGALTTLQEQAYGSWLLATVAFGLLAFATYSFVEARYRCIPTEQASLPN